MSDANTDTRSPAASGQPHSAKAKAKAVPPQALLPWLIIAHIDGMYSRLFNRLLDTFHTPDAVLGASRQQLHATGLDPAMVDVISRAGMGNLPDKIRAAVNGCLAWQDEHNHSIIHTHSPHYPALLRNIPDPPPLLYVRGNPGNLREPMIALVGSRRPTVDGRRNARYFAGELVVRGLGVCSGLALGIDVESHAGALQEGGKTVAVLGTGIDVIYPARNRAMFDRIANEGTLVTEFNPGTPPRPENFPRRNRIISGLSLGVLVVEAGMQSGSMITARFGLEQGREVFAIPGSIHNPMAKGCHHLILQGAKLVQQVADITDECGTTVISRANADESDAPNTDIQLPALSGGLARILAGIGRDPVTADVLLRETGLAIDQVSTALVELELHGLIRRESGGFVLAVPD